MKPSLESQIRISRKFKQVVITLCLGSMMCGDIHALCQSVKSAAAVFGHAGYLSVGNQQTIVQDTYFSYDVRGNILAKTVNGNKKTYSYNAINQLTQIQNPDGSIINLAKDYNTLGDMQHGPNNTLYSYNILGQLTEFQSQKTGIQAQYRYYASGLRSKKVIISNPTVKPTDYYYDNAKNANIVNEKQGQFSTSYLLASGHMVRYVYDGAGNINKQIAIHGNKDVSMIVDDQGKIQESYHYSPNGVTLSPQEIGQFTDPKPIGLSIMQNPFQYSGEYRDSESGLEYLRARYYNPKIQRFIQHDSYQLLNRYGYAKGNPIMQVDPSGHHSKVARDVIIAIVSIGAAIFLSNLPYQFHIVEKAVQEHFAEQPLPDASYGADSRRPPSRSSISSSSERKPPIIRHKTLVSDDESFQRESAIGINLEELNQSTEDMEHNAPRKRAPTSYCQDAAKTQELNRALPEALRDAAKDVLVAQDGQMQVDIVEPEGLFHKRVAFAEVIGERHLYSYHMGVTTIASRTPSWPVFKDSY